MLGFLFVFRFLLLGVFSFVQFVWEGPLILPLVSSFSFVSFLSHVSFLLLIYFSSFLIKKKKKSLLEVLKCKVSWILSFCLFSKF